MSKAPGGRRVLAPNPKNWPPQAALSGSDTLPKGGTHSGARADAMQPSEGASGLAATAAAAWVDGRQPPAPFPPQPAAAAAEPAAAPGEAAQPSGLRGQAAAEPAADAAAAASEQLDELGAALPAQPADEPVGQPPRPGLHHLTRHWLAEEDRGEVVLQRLGAPDVRTAEQMVRCATCCRCHEPRHTPPCVPACGKLGTLLTPNGLHPATGDTTAPPLLTAAAGTWDSGS